MILKRAILLVAGAALLCAAGCGTMHRKIGPPVRTVSSTRVETRQAPVPNWPVWVFVNSHQVGQFTTDSQGQVPLDYRAYANYAQPGKGLRIEFRFRQPTGQVTSKFFDVPAHQVWSGGR